MNMVDRLLKADVVNKLAERPEKKVKMERLSKLFGFDFVITIRAIDPERYADIQKMAVDFTNGSADNIDIYQMQTQTLLAGIADPDPDAPGGDCRSGPQEQGSAGKIRSCTP